MTHETDRVLHISVPGIPRPQPRPVIKRIGRGKARVISTPDPKAALWQEGLAQAIRRALAGVGKDWLPRKGEALSASVVFRMPGGKGELVTPMKELSLDQIGAMIGPGASQGNDGSGVTVELRVIPVDRFAASRPDIDNMLKLVMDVLKGEGALGELDDCAIVEVNARKIVAR
jgi:hypothetical protein